MLKFNSMLNDINADGKPVPNTERLTRTGRFLRLYSLNELPQLVNVFKGEMSLIGPRPMLAQEIRQLKHAGFEREIHIRESVLPGITGLAQISARRFDPEHDLNENNFQKKRLEKDVVYATLRDFGAGIDGRILLKTFSAVTKGESQDRSTDFFKYEAAGQPQQAQLL